VIKERNSTESATQASKPLRKLKKGRRKKKKSRAYLNSLSGFSEFRYSFFAEQFNGNTNLTLDFVTLLFFIFFCFRSGFGFEKS
jgi:hypothetical protein